MDKSSTEKTGFLPENNLWPVIRYGVARYKIFMILFVVLLILSALLLISGNADENLRIYDGVQKVLDLATVGLALFIGYSTIAKRWEESLPKQLDVVFTFENYPVLVCEGASLSGEGDIRALAQQMGKQMNFETPLSFGPYSEITKVGVKKHSYVLYQVKIPLIVNPINVSQSTLAKEADKFRSEKGLASDKRVTYRWWLDQASQLKKEFVTEEHVAF